MVCCCHFGVFVFHIMNVVVDNFVVVVAAVVVIPKVYWIISKIAHFKSKVMFH